MLTLVTGKEIEDRYVIHSSIGTGGFATVWRASDKQLNRDVALKRLLKYTSESGADEAKRILAEARKHAQLVHTNIVQVYDVIECEGEHLIVMEYVDGQSLEGLLRDNARKGSALALDNAISILQDVLAGVAFAHDKKTIHRDLTPSNILLTSTGVPKVCDFGIARLVGPRPVESTTSTQGGTGNPNYMSPEQHRGEEADPSSDLFMVGITGYLLLTGRHPFAHPSGLFSIRDLITDDNYTPEAPKPTSALTTSQQRLYREYAAVVMRLLNRERAGRFANAREAIAAIEAVTPSQECLQCGERVPEHSRYCMFCGQLLSKPEPPSVQPSAPARAVVRSVDDLVQEGFLLSRVRRWDEAIDRYVQALKIDGQNTRALRNLGYALNAVGQFEEAVQTLSRGLAQNLEQPSHRASFLHERAIARSELKDYEGAMQDVNEALRLLPFSVKSLHLRARIHLYRGEGAEARRDAQEVLRRNPDHIGAARLLDQTS